MAVFSETLLHPFRRPIDRLLGVKPHYIACCLERICLAHVVRAMLQVVLACAAPAVVRHEEADRAICESAAG
jgi:hypothetical protein